LGAIDVVIVDDSATNEPREAGIGSVKIVNESAGFNCGADKN